MKRLFRITIFGAMILLASNAYSIQFEDYQWGSSEESVLRSLEDKGISVEENMYYSLTDEVKISYKRKNFYGSPCTVTFEVSREFGLYEIFIVWEEMPDAKYFQKGVKVNLLNNYGPPTESDAEQVELDEEYNFWMEGDSWREGDFSVNLVGEYPDSKSSNGVVSFSYVNDKISDEMHQRLMDATEWLDY